jgi:hypothetical protein
MACSLGFILNGKEYCIPTLVNPHEPPPGDPPPFVDRDWGKDIAIVGVNVHYEQIHALATGD